MLGQRIKEQRKNKNNKHFKPREREVLCDISMASPWSSLVWIIRVRFPIKERG